MLTEGHLVLAGRQQTAAQGMQELLQAGNLAALDTTWCQGSSIVSGCVVCRLCFALPRCAVLCRRQQGFKKGGAGPQTCCMSMTGAT